MYIISRLYLIIILLLLIATILGGMLITDDLYYQSYSGQMSQDMIMKILDIRHRYDWVAYIVSAAFVKHTISGKTENVKLFTVQTFCWNLLNLLLKY